MKIYNVYQSGKRLYIDEKENPDNKIVVNKYDNMQQTLRLISDGTLPPRLYWALRNPKLSNKYFILKLVNNEDLIVGTDISAYAGLWDMLLIGTDEDYIIEGADIDQSRLTYVSDHFGRLFVRDNFLEELDFEEQVSPTFKVFYDEIMLKIDGVVTDDDIKEMNDKIDDTLELSKNASEKADKALSLAKGATKAFVYDTYEDMISDLNVLSTEELNLNYHIMIRTVCVPDLWISGVSDEHVEYTYTSNEDFIADLTEDGVVQVGYFVLSALETQKVELDDYVKKDEYATDNKCGLVKGGGNCGTHIHSSSGTICIDKAVKSEIDGKANNYKPIVPATLDYAVMKALSDSKLEWTEEQKQLARALLGSVGFSDYASDTNFGIARFRQSNGIICTNGDAYINDASEKDIDNRTTSNRNVIMPRNLDYAIKSGLVKNALEWTEEEKQAVRTLLGSVGSKDYANGKTHGLVRFDEYYGITGGSSGSAGVPIPVWASKENIDNKSGNRFLKPSIIDYAVKKALSDCKLSGDDAWTDEEKTLARTLLGAIGSNNVASKDNLGVIRAFPTGDKNVPGVGLSGNNVLGVVKATDAEIAEQTNTVKPIVPSNLSYAIKVGLSNSNVEWTAEEKAKALELLGGMQKDTSETPYPQLYTKNKDGSFSMTNMSNVAAGNTVVIRDPKGCVYTKTPTEDVHATTKKYVDDNFINITKSIESVGEHKTWDNCNTYSISEVSMDAYGIGYVYKIDENILKGRDISKMSFSFHFYDSDFNGHYFDFSFDNVPSGYVLENQSIDENLQAYMLYRTANGDYTTILELYFGRDYLGNAEDSTYFIANVFGINENGLSTTSEIMVTYDDTEEVEKSGTSPLDIMTLKSPNGTQFKITVADDGTLSSDGNPLVSKEYVDDLVGDIETLLGGI